MTDREILANAIDKAIANGLELIELVNYPAIALIYRHSFAKAFWGEDEIAVVKAGNHMIQRWQFHLQNMVLEENPIKYLEKFL